MSARDYIQCLKENKHYRLIWIAEVVDNIGAWLNYVATLSLVESFSHGSGLALSLVILVRMLPSFVLSPLAGVIADRLNRVMTLRVTSFLSAIAAALLVFCREESQSTWFYFLLLLQFSCVSVYDPSRRAMIPVVVPGSQLPIATTIDSFAWSITGAVGAALGGIVASKLGIVVCFLLDAATYLLACVCAHQLPLHIGDPLAYRKSVLVEEEEEKEEEEEEEEEAQEASNDGNNMKTVAILSDNQTDSLLSQDGSGATRDLMAVAETSSILHASVHAWKDGLDAYKEGWDYVHHQNNKDVAALVYVKGCGSLIWGAVDILNVKISEMKSMQQLGDASTTLGIIFACVGWACFVGPIIFSAAVPPKPRPLIWSVVASFALLFIGSLLLAVATNIYGVLLATWVRSMGSAVLWVQSSLIMQLRVENELLGRVSALEMALYTLAEILSSLYGGAAFDVLHMTMNQVLWSVTLLASVITAFWTGHALFVGPKRESFD